MEVYGIINTGNDSDIIGLSLKHNLKFFNKVIIIDNNSVDGTKEILESICLEYPGRISVIHTESKNPEQHVITINFIKEQIKTSIDQPDYLFFLDADEFIHAENLDELKTIPENFVGEVKWKCYIPNKLDHKNYPEEMLYRRDHEPTGCHKVVLPKTTNGFLILGNHYLHQNDQRVSSMELKTIFLAHYPVRSIEQIKKKMDFVSKFLKYENPNQSYHLRKQIQLETLEDLIKMATYYADNNKEEYSIVYDPLPK